jgi:hypothetical protein
MSTSEIRENDSQAAHGYSPDEMSTGERTGAAKLKWVVIVDEALSPGQAVNAAVCVAAATAPGVPGLLGAGGPDASAQATRVYDDYLRELAKTEPGDLAPLAISLIGPRNQVAKLVRRLELLP